METNRLEAFSDGVIAVIITIMVLELKPPHEPTLQSALALWPAFLTYALSFIIVAIMWVNHHHFLNGAKRADTPLLWSNNNLLFWMSLIPLVTAYLGEHDGAPLAVAAYGAVLTLVSFSFMLLQRVLGGQDLSDTVRLVHYRRESHKAAFSGFLYALASALAFASVKISFAIFVLIPMLYFWPTRAVAKD